MYHTFVLPVNPFESAGTPIQFFWKRSFLPRKRKDAFDRSSHALIIRH